MRVLGIDPSSKTGWAYTDSKGRIFCGTEVFTGTRPTRIDAFSAWLREIDAEAGKDNSSKLERIKAVVAELENVDVS